MATESDQVKALQRAILERAQELSAEHVSQGELTRAKIIADAREKIKLMEQKELLAARVHADREYQRQVQASELRIQAELDRNRWGLVQAVMDRLLKQLIALRDDEAGYEKIFKNLLRQGVETIAGSSLVASISNDDRTRFQDNWEAIVKASCAKGVEVKLSPEACDCSGGVRLVSEQGDIMIDNTFEGIIERRQQVLQRLIFERLFSTLATQGTVFDG
ncbi:MAG: V-type ATP synthase subunit E [Gammaproteobacteria bacterium]|nr:MAG: V-type ATP synthase subunit E [Gammaproteobacteria bacterium]